MWILLLWFLTDIILLSVQSTETCWKCLVWLALLSSDLTLRNVHFLVHYLTSSMSYTLVIPALNTVCCFVSLFVDTHYWYGLRHIDLKVNQDIPLLNITFIFVSGEGDQRSHIFHCKYIIVTLMDKRWVMCWQMNECSVLFILRKQFNQKQYQSCLFSCIVYIVYRWLSILMLYSTYSLLDISCIYKIIANSDVSVQHKVQVLGLIFTVKGVPIEDNLFLKCLRIYEKPRKQFSY